MNKKNYYINENGDRLYRNIHGQLHRLDGPAWEDLYGNKAWFKEGKYHRNNNPAIEYIEGNKLWWVEGNLHRLDGPAIFNINGHKEWWILGKELQEYDFNSWIFRIKIFI